ncbi:MAG: glycosyltransferase family 9 protein [Gemmataceae bacterium]
MKVATMRLLDRWLGVPACFLLSGWRRLFGRRTPDLSFQPRRVLFVKLAEQGSTVLAYPVLKSAVDRFGRENVFFLLFAENRPVLDFLDVIPSENVIAINARGIVRTMFGAVKALWRLRRLKIDVAIDLEFFARSSAALSYLSGARWRVGFHAFGGEAAYRGNLMTHRLSFNPYLHTSQTFHMMLDAIEHPAAGFPTFPMTPPRIAEAGPRFEPSVTEKDDLRRLLDDTLGRWARRPLILLNANASDLMPLRRWDSGRYVELARRLLERYPDAVIGFTGAPSEAQAVETLVAQIDSPRCVSFAGKTTFRQLIVLYGCAEVLVTNDSGPAHFATLTPIDVVVLFGPETPVLFAARSPRTHPLWAGLACSPCINAFNDRNSACRDNVCMKQISVDEVFVMTCRIFERRLVQRQAA